MKNKNNQWNLHQFVELNEGRHVLSLCCKLVEVWIANSGYFSISSRNYYAAFPTMVLRTCTPVRILGRPFCVPPYWGYEVLASAAKSTKHMTIRKKSIKYASRKWNAHRQREDVGISQDLYTLRVLLQNWPDMKGSFSIRRISIRRTLSLTLTLTLILTL